jgi:hypothetical protein
MTIINQKSISGITSITTAAAGDNLLTVHTNDGTERLRIDSSGNTRITAGIVTTLTVTGTSTFNDDVTFTGTNYNATWNKSDGELEFADNAKATFGAGGDLMIYHDGSHSYVLDNGTGDLRLASNSITRITKGDSETCAAFNVDGASELYYDNTKKFETTSSGLTIHEDTDKTISFTGGIGEIGNVTGFQALNTAGSALVDFGMRANTLRFATGSAERLRIDSSGNLGIGCDDPQYQIDLSASSLDHLFTGAINAEQDGGDYALKLTALGKSGGRTGSVRFITGTSSPGSEVARFTTAGLTFGGDTAAANALDDYEEGTFTATCANSVTLHSDTDLCQYVKIGSSVTVMGQIRVNNSNSSSDLTVNNLPFAVYSSGEASAYAVGAVRLYVADMSSLDKYVVCLADGGSTNLQFQGVRDNAASVPLSATGDGYYMFSITYRTSS